MVRARVWADMRLMPSCEVRVSRFVCHSLQRSDKRQTQARSQDEGGNMGLRVAHSWMRGVHDAQLHGQGVKVRLPPPAEIRPEP